MVRVRGNLALLWRLREALMLRVYLPSCVEPRTLMNLERLWQARICLRGRLLNRREDKPPARASLAPGSMI